MVGVRAARARGLHTHSHFYRRFFGAAHVRKVPGSNPRSSSNPRSRTRPPQCEFFSSHSRVAVRAFRLALRERRRRSATRSASLYSSQCEVTVSQCELYSSHCEWLQLALRVCTARTASVCRSHCESHALALRLSRARTARKTLRCRCPPSRVVVRRPSLPRSPRRRGRRC